MIWGCGVIAPYGADPSTTPLIYLSFTIGIDILAFSGAISTHVGTALEMENVSMGACCKG